MKSLRILISCILALGLTSCGALTGAAGSLIRAPMSLLKGMSGAVGRSTGILGQTDSNPSTESSEAIAQRGAEIQRKGPYGLAPESEDDSTFASAPHR